MYTQVISHMDAASGMTLDREGEKPVITQHTVGLEEHGKKVFDVTEDIGRKDQIGRVFGLAGHPRCAFTDLQTIIEPGSTRNFEHFLREVGPGKAKNTAFDGLRHQAGSAAKIQPFPEDTMACNLDQRIRDQCRRAICQRLCEMLLEPRRILIKERGDIARRHRTPRCTQSRKPGTRAQSVIRV